MVSEKNEEGKEIIDYQEYIIAMLFTFLILLKKSRPDISNYTIKDHQIRLYSVSCFVWG